MPSGASLAGARPARRGAQAALAGPRRRSGSGPGLRLAGVAAALLIEGGLLVALLRPARPLRLAEPSVQAVLVVPPRQEPERPVLPPPPVTLPRLPLPITPPPLVVLPREDPPPVPLQTAPSRAITLPAPPPPPPQSAAPGIEDRFKAAVRDAVYSAYRVPDAARLLSLYGETRVAFALTDGAIGDVRLIGPSGHAALDAAALEAVRRAAYPEAPPALRGRTLSFEIVLYHHRTGP